MVKGYLFILCFCTLTLLFSCSRQLSPIETSYRLENDRLQEGLELGQQDMTVEYVDKKTVFNSKTVSGYVRYLDTIGLPETFVLELKQKEQGIFEIVDTLQRSDQKGGFSFRLHSESEFIAFYNLGFKPVIFRVQ